ncbi:hypothetical protein BOX15_Mlig022917g3 [Macrostomum lignano]|uniref:Kinesin-like protein n=1 Tax=Macrostomum lignano TaxID=282301 RepID=A0A267DI29_9PLAT|nr:hypothetical protein BOX15_Mlig022917g3 [Macrostomum lignano]
MLSRTPGRKLCHINSQPCEAVEVFCRIKPPPLSTDFEDCLTVKDDRTVVLERTSAMRSTEYTFTRVFDDASKQSEVFSSAGLPLVEELVQGRNGLLFTYGVTGSGKSFTMQGHPDNPGLLPRCLDSLFNSVGSRLAKKFVIQPDRCNGFDIHSEAEAMMERQRVELERRHGGWRQLEAEAASRIRESARVPLGELEGDAFGCAVFVSYVEIYNKLAYDLLEDFGVPGQVLRAEPTSRALREDARRNMYVSGALEVECRSGDEAFAVFLKGCARRQVAQTALNAESSRSHSVFTIRLVRGCYDCRLGEMVPDKSLLHVSQLCLVDLAGSERSLRTGNAGSRLREASNINNSLLVLKRCIEALRENQRAVSAGGANAATKIVPYRESKMTQLFKNFFDGDGSVKMVLCVNRNAEEVEETANVLKFAEMASEVQVVRSKVPQTPRWQAATPRPQVPSAPPSSSESAEDGSSGRMWQFDSILQVSPSAPDSATAAAGGSLRESQWELWEQRARLFRAELDAAWDGGSGSGDLLEEVQRLQAAHRAEKARLEKRLRNAEMRLCKDRAAADTGKKELLSRLEDQENQLRRERADKERLRDQFKYRMDAVQKSAVRPRLRRSRSQEQLNADAAAAPTPGLVSRLRCRFSPGASGQKAPPPQPQELPPPPSNPRSRRSRSAGQLVVDHHAKHETPSGTVLCAKVPGKRKSVTKLEVRDIRKATDYVLTHQTADGSGGLRTEVYKGSVTPTAGGGSAVRFNDIEMLSQISPTQLVAGGFAAGDTSWLLSSAARRRRASIVGVAGSAGSSGGRKRRAAAIAGNDDDDNEGCRRTPQLPPPTPHLVGSPDAASLTSEDDEL